MKKAGIITALMCMCICGAFAEEMHFITVFSNPVGIFQQVGVTVSSTTVKNLAFGNARSPSGTITTDKLTAGGKLQIQSENAVSLRDGGSVEQALVADTVRFGVANNKGKSLTVSGAADVNRIFSSAGIKHQSVYTAIEAKTGTFTRFESAAMKMNTPATGDLLRSSFVWENVPCTSGDTTCNNTATNKNSLLLVSSGGTVATCTGSDTAECGCLHDGIKTRTCNNGVWSSWSACSTNETCHWHIYAGRCGGLCSAWLGDYGSYSAGTPYCPDWMSSGRAGDTCEQEGYECYLNETYGPYDISSNSECNTQTGEGICYYDDFTFWFRCE